MKKFQNIKNKYDVIILPTLTITGPWTTRVIQKSLRPANNYPSLLSLGFFGGRIWSPYHVMKE